MQGFYLLFSTLFSVLVFSFIKCLFKDLCLPEKRTGTLFIKTFTFTYGVASNIQFLCAAMFGVLHSNHGGKQLIDWHWLKPKEATQKVNLNVCSTVCFSQGHMCMSTIGTFILQITHKKIRCGAWVWLNCNLLCVLFIHIDTDHTSDKSINASY